MLVAASGQLLGAASTLLLPLEAGSHWLLGLICPLAKKCSGDTFGLSKEGSKIYYQSPDCKITDRDFMPLFMGFPIIYINCPLFQKPRIEHYSHLYNVAELFSECFAPMDFNRHLKIIV